MTFAEVNRPLHPFRRVASQGKLGGLDSKDPVGTEDYIAAIPRLVSTKSL